MITLEDALEIIKKQSVQLQTEKVPLTDSLNRILAKDIFSDISMPPFDKSAMDGYACRKSDLQNDLEIIEIIPAGKNPEKAIQQNQCAKIMTGARVPKGADTVVMIEHSEQVDETHIRFVKENTKSNICYLGEDVQEGQQVLSKGMMIRPQHIAVLASVGCSEVLVYKTPKVGILTTGSELTEPEQVPGPSQIRNSNAYQLLAQLKMLSIDATYYGIVADTEDELKAKISEAIESNDLIILTGGVSVGDFDLVPEILKELNFESKFRQVAIQPGKPVSLANAGDKICFGLSGNPVSSFFQFELLVKPLIYNLMGHAFAPTKYACEITEKKNRKRSDRLQHFPVSLTLDGKVKPVEFHGSAHIAALLEAEGIAAFLIGETEIEENSKVYVRPI